MFPRKPGLEGNNMICQTVENTKEKQVIKTVAQGLMRRNSSAMYDGEDNFELIYLVGSAWKMRYETSSMMNHRGSGTAVQGLIYLA